MTEYRAPLEDIEFCLFDIAGLGAMCGPDQPECDRGSAREILAAAARIAQDVIAPLDRDSDRIGARFQAGRVALPPGYRDAYRKWRAGGWLAVDAPEAIGGMGQPVALGAALTEIWHSSSMGFAMGLLLTQAAAEVLEAFGTLDLRDAYIPHLLSGRFTGAMSLSEPQAGTDLGLIRTEALPDTGGCYRIFGDKIFISYGEHDMADNVVHMVLARTPGAPGGTGGLSLFLVPKRLPGDGDPCGQANDLACLGIEHKLGLRGSPTCTMRYGHAGKGAQGWLLGEEGQGLAAMFTMMNRARLGTGLQGTAVAEHATQKAVAYAAQRVQGGQAIDRHPDIARTLVAMQADVMACRAISYLSAVAIDQATGLSTTEARRLAAERAAFLTPIAKAFCSDVGCEVSSSALQVHGGMGYIEETGASQLFRDARIAPIYEGANGIQAIDLVERKIVRGGPNAARRLIREILDILAEAKRAPDQRLKWCALECEAATKSLQEALAWLIAPGRHREERLWGATAFLALFGTVLGGALLLKGALAVPDTASRDRWSRLAGAFALGRVSHCGALARQTIRAAELLDTQC